MKMPERPPYTSKDYNYGDILEELIKSSKFHEFFELNDNRYPYWVKWKYIAKAWGIEEKKIWSAVKSARLGSKLIRFSSLNGFEFRISTPSIIQNYLHEFDLNLGGSLQGEGIIPTEDRDRYLISSLMEEAIASSQLEGAATTRKIAKEMLENERKPRNTSEQMILNNYEAMKWIVANKNDPFSPEAICHVHAIITNNTLYESNEEGTFRQDNEVRVVDVQTGNTVYTPPTHDQLKRLMEDFCRFANDLDNQAFFIHPILKGIFFHFLIGYIHPFADGNGRTARTIFYWYLLKKGYWLIEYMSVSRVILGSKAQYSTAYLHTEFDDNDLTYFLIYNLKSISTALEDLKKYIHRKTAEKKNVLTLLRNTSFNDRQIVILQEIMQNLDSFFSVKQIQNKFGISNQTARNDLQGLVNKGLIEFRKSGIKKQFFPAGDFYDKVKKGL